MGDNAGSLLKKVLEKIKPEKNELAEINSAVIDFREKSERKIKKLRIKAEIFIGGSFAKKTMIKKDFYDIDAFLRFDKKYISDDISGLAGRIISDFKKTRIHGSRDYFQIKISDALCIEVIPVIKISKPKDAENVTDLSYSHVRYVKKKAKSEKMLDEIILAKAFCYANKCYGAESHISGFSGYSIELLVIHYKSFLKFIKAFKKIKEGEVVDIEKHFKNKNEVFINLNESKLKSPVILIDPTNKQRNALAALSGETFQKFRKICSDFLKKPSEKFFEKKAADFNAIKKHAEKNNFEFAFVKAKTEKQKGAVAGSKLLKFQNHLKNEISRFFDVKNSEFSYGNGDSADFAFAAKKKKEILLNGPKAEQKENAEKFRKKHKNIFIKSGRIYAREKINLGLKEFLKRWAEKNRQKMKEMSVDKVEVN